MFKPNERDHDRIVKEGLPLACNIYVENLDHSYLCF